jgi:23S rRNA (pseudouridine1915-N3)-methyltransferase
MLLTVAHIGSKPAKSGVKAGFESLTRLYLDRIVPYYTCNAESFPTEAALLAWLERQQGRVPAIVTLLDSRGRQLSSEEFAVWVGARRDQGAQHLVFAIGPADGWSQETLQAVRPQLTLSFGPITLPHELARLVLAEQLYRACTILAGHPYHSGH